VSDARILDRGYRPYDGARRGVSGAVASLVRHSVQRALGIRRPPWAKLLPVLSVGIAYVPAVVFVGIVGFVPERLLERNFLPSYAEYYGFVTSAIVVFTAFVAPEVLCPDRRTGLLGLYLASPLTRDTYLVAKAIAVALVLALVTLGPPLVLLIAFTLQGTGPDGPGDIAVVAVRIIAAGVAISAVHSAISLAAASLTDRRALASAGVLLALLVSGVSTAILVESVGAPEWMLVFNLLALPFELVQRIYGQPGDSPAVSTAALLTANLGWTLAAAVLVRMRYQRLQVTR
jgi:ABC-2 type transport system permease protein